MAELNLDNLEEVSGGVNGTSGYYHYTLKSGDTLSQLGATYGCDWHTIQKINKISDDEVKKLQPGRVLLIPKPGTTVR